MMLDLLHHQAAEFLRLIQLVVKPLIGGPVITQESLDLLIVDGRNPPTNIC